MVSSMPKSERKRGSVSVLPAVRRVSEVEKKRQVAVALVEAHVRRLVDGACGAKIVVDLERALPVFSVEADKSDRRGVDEIMEGVKDRLEIVFENAALRIEESMDCLRISEKSAEEKALPKARNLLEERFIFTGEVPKTINYRGQMNIDQVRCLQAVSRGRRVVHSSSQKTSEGQTMAVFTRYPVAMDGWNTPKKELEFRDINNLNLCEVLNIPHTNDDFARARKAGSPQVKVLIKGLGHFAVILPKGKTNPLNLAPLSAYPADSLSALNQAVNRLLVEHPEYAKVSVDGGGGRVPQFDEEEMRGLMEI